jgi:hypothetical protein
MDATWQKKSNQKENKNKTLKKTPDSKEAQETKLLN